MHIIIPMSGIGKRFIDAGYTVPKPLIFVEGKPIIYHIIDLFPGETKFTFICNDKHLKTTNMRQILLDKIPNANIVCVDVNNRKGPVDAVLKASSHIDDNDEIIISYCDYGTVWSYEQFKNEIKDTNITGGAIACYTGFHPHMLGNDNYAFVKETDLWMDGIQEKQPYTNNKMNEYASNGTYYFRSGAIVKKYFQQLIDQDISIRGEYYVSMVYNLLKSDGLAVKIFPIEKMLQWGTPRDLEEYLVWSNYFLKRDLSFNTHFIDKYSTTLILPMAGAGSRFFTVGYDTPKPLLDIEGLPMVIQAVKQLPATTNKVFICQNEHLIRYPIQSNIHTHFNNSTLIGIDYVTQGQACTCEIALKTHEINMDLPIMISACDNGVYYDVAKYSELVDDPNVDIIIWSFSNNPTAQLYPNMYAWLDVDENDYIRRVSIKKPFSDCQNKYAIIGTMLFKKARYFQEGLDLIYKSEYKTNGEYYVDNMIEPLINAGYKCKIFNVSNYLCWGTPNDYKTYLYWQEYFCSPKFR